MTLQWLQWLICMIENLGSILGVYGKHSKISLAKKSAAMALLDDLFGLLKSLYTPCRKLGAAFAD